MEATEILVFVAIIVFGFAATGVYYFARYFYFKGDQIEPPGESDLPVEPKKLVKETPVKTASLAEALSKSRSGIWSRFSSGQDIDESSLEEFEEALYLADLGPKTVSYFIEKATSKLSTEALGVEDLKLLFRQEIQGIFDEGTQGTELLDNIGKSGKPHVIMIVGVNGAGKTTTIGKLAHYFSKKNMKVMVAAGDTFRAAAESQLNMWADRSNTEIFKAPENTKDPGAVAFQALERAKSQGTDIVLLDTAGRLHTQSNLMAELEKVKRVLQKQGEDFPQDVWMVLDANTGQNALFQTESFNAALGVTGVVMTKVDGSAKAGVAVGVKHSLKIPIVMIGLGEKMEDLREFESRLFVDSLV